MEEEDLVVRSTKKVKTQGESLDSGPTEMEEEQPKEEEIPSDATNAKGSHGSRKSYRDSLLADGIGGNLSSQDIVNIVTEEYILDNPVEELLEEPAPFNPKPNIEVSLKEYDEWCRSWKFSLIVKLLRKRLGFHAMAMWIRRAWA